MWLGLMPAIHAHACKEFTAKNGMEQPPCIYGMSQLHSCIEGNFPLSFFHGPMEINIENILSAMTQTTHSSLEPLPFSLPL